MTEDMNTLIDLDEELRLINQEMAVMDELYDETKTHFDQVKRASRNGSGGSLSFVHLQTANLISLKGSKIGLIKDRVAIKKALADFVLKKMNLDKEKDGGSGALTVELFKMISGNTQVKPEDIVSAMNASQEMSEDELDALLEARIAEEESKLGGQPEGLGEVDPTMGTVELEPELDEMADPSLFENTSEDEDPGEVSDEEEEEVYYVSDTQGNLYVVNQRYEIQEDYDISDMQVVMMDGKAFLEGDEIEVYNF